MQEEIFVEVVGLFRAHLTEIARRIDAVEARVSTAVGRPDVAALADRVIRLEEEGVRQGAVNEQRSDDIGSLSQTCDMLDSALSEVSGNLSRYQSDNDAATEVLRGRQEKSEMDIREALSSVNGLAASLARLYDRVDLMAARDDR